MRLWYLSQRRPAKAQVSLRIREVSPEPSVFAHTKNGSRRRVQPKNQTSSPTGWLRMRLWIMSLRRTRRTIISWAGSFEPPQDKTNKMVSAPNEDSDQPWHPPRLIWVFAGRTCHFVGFVMRRLIYHWNHRFSLCRGPGNTTRVSAYLATSREKLHIARIVNCSVNCIPRFPAVQLYQSLCCMLELNITFAEKCIVRRLQDSQ